MILAIHKVKISLFFSFWYPPSKLSPPKRGSNYEIIIFLCETKIGGTLCPFYVKKCYRTPFAGAATVLRVFCSPHAFDSKTLVILNVRSIVQVGQIIEHFESYFINQLIIYKSTL